LKFPEFLPRVFHLINHPKAILRREALWVISNITAGTPKQIEMIMENQEYISRLKTIVATDTPTVNKNLFKELTF